MDAVAQRTEALEKANQYRLAVSVKRRELASMPYAEGHLALAELIENTDDPAMLSGRVSHWLSAPRRFGTAKASRVMAQMGIRSSDRRLRDLTPRQRKILADAVRAKYRVSFEDRAA